MRMLTIALPLTAMALAACHHEARIYDGRVPEQYVYQAQQYTGDYKGQFEQVPTKMGIYMEQDRPYVVVQNQQNDDLIGAQCQSQVGQLTKVKGTRQDNVEWLEEATWDFKGGNCNYVDQELKLEFSQDHRQFKATVKNKTDKREYTGYFYR